MTTIRFYWTWFQLGRGYWKHRHIWTLMAYLEHASKPAPRTLDDELSAWIAAQEQDTE